MCVCVCVLAGMLGYGVKVSLCKYAEHGGPRTGAEGEHGVAELIYLMTERLISPQPWLESMLDEGSDRGECAAPRP